MCIDYIDLNKACLKDFYLLPSIHELVNVVSRSQFLSFMDAYSGYNQIPMHPLDEEKTAFITLMVSYYYKFMLVGLKYVMAIYQRLLNQIFADHTETLMEVYIDNMLVKTTEEDKLSLDLETVFGWLYKHRIRLNLKKCTFAMKVGKFLGFMLIYWGIEGNSDKCRAILKMTSPISVKEVQCWTRRIGSLSSFLAALAQKV